MKGQIPRKASWCVACVKAGGVCEDHLGPRGKARDYTGPDVYELSQWVLDVVGGYYRGWDGKTYLCTGFDPRAGFWMKAVDGSRVTNVSVRAIDATFHRVRLIPGSGSHRLLLFWIQNKRPMTPTEAEERRVSLPEATSRLRFLNLVDEKGPTKEGRLLAKQEHGSL